MGMGEIDLNLFVRSPLCLPSYNSSVENKNVIYPCAVDFNEKTSEHIGLMSVVRLVWRPSLKNILTAETLRHR